MVRLCRKPVVAAIVTGLSAIGWFGATSLVIPKSAIAQAMVQCEGQLPNGWFFNAEYQNGLFRRIVWSRTGNAPRVSSLRYDPSSVQREPTYLIQTGEIPGRLVDLSFGNVQTGSTIRLEIPGLQPIIGVCGTPMGGPATPVPAVRYGTPISTPSPGNGSIQNLIGEDYEWVVQMLKTAGFAPELDQGNWVNGQSRTVWRRNTDGRRLEFIVTKTRPWRVLDVSELE